MRAIKAFGPKDLRLVELPDPTPGPGEVLIRVHASGICGSDKEYWLQGPTDGVYGHEAMGEVVALGEGVKHLRVGERVAINNVIGCGRCAACRAGRFVFCPHRPGRDVNGGYGEMLVAPERNCLRLDERVGDEAGCLIFDNWGTPYAALKRNGVGEGDDLVIFGCGPIGLAAAVLAKHRGAYVIAVDPVAYRREAALRLAADHALAPDEDLPAAVRALTSGRGASVVLECSGQGAAYALGLAALRIGGTLVAVGEGARFDLRPSEGLIHRHLKIVGSWYSTMAEGREVQELIVTGAIDPLVFVTHRVGLEEVPRALARFASREEGVLKTVVVMKK
ncbi:MAG: zinc-dependent alcohol dehydrogenase [Bacillota bacterium]